MKSRKFFKNKAFTICFIVYVFLTLFIFATSLSSASESAKQSNFVGTVVSNVVSFITNDKVDLKNDGKTHDYPDEIVLSVPERELMVGESIQTSFSLLPSKNYKDATIEYHSSNEEVATISKSGILDVVGVGTSKITASIKGQPISATKTISVGFGVFTPTFDFEIVYSSADDETGERQGKFYYSNQTATGGLYSMQFQTNVLKKNVSCSANDPSAFEFLNGENDVCFYTKKCGYFTLNFNYVYNNINGKNTLTHQVPITVIDGYPFEQDGEPLVSSTSQNLEFDTKTPYYLNYNQNASPLLARRCIKVSAPSAVKVSFVQDMPDKLKISCKKAGNYTLTIFYAGKDGLTSLSLNLIVSATKPIETSFISTHDYTNIDSKLSITPVGDGEVLSASDFAWSVSNEEVASIENGKLYGKNFGKVTVTAVSKYFDDVVITAEFTVRRPFLYTVRKVIGHLLLFLTLAIFASIVYRRLAKCNFYNHVTLISILFTLSAGLLTAGISECLQNTIFTIGRGPSFDDFLIDVVGFLLGYLFYFLTKRLIIYIRKRKSKNN